MNGDFVLASLVVAITPGAGTMYTLSTALLQGRRAGIVAAFGCTIGIVPHLLVSLSGLAWLLERNLWLFESLRVIGVGYLLYLAWGQWTDRSTLSLGQPNVVIGSKQIVWQAVLLNLFNPKLTLFFVAFLPLFLESDSRSPTLQLIELSLVFMGITLVVFSGYGWLASLFRKLVLERLHIWVWVRRAFALAFFGLAIGLIVDTLR